MRPVKIKRGNYKDEVVRRHRRSFIFKTISILVVAIGIIVGLAYFLFFANLFDIRTIEFNGLNTVNSDEFSGKINERLDQKIFNLFPRRNNIFFVNTKNFETEIISAYPVFKLVDVRRKLFHGLVFNFTERKPLGVWCFTEQDSLKESSCSYFDEERVLWGKTAKSSGFIFLTIDDQRGQNEKWAEDEFFEPIMFVAKSMAGEIKKVLIPKDSFSEFRVYTYNYYIIFTIESDIQGQLDTLKIFLTEKSNDQGFRPQYIDLRIDGRVYYK